MKLKILLAPVLLILIVVVAIWIISPAYADWKIKKGELVLETAKLNDIKEKNFKAEKAYGILNSNPEKRAVILTYIPEKEQEEDVIDNLNSLASASGLALFDLSIATVARAVPEPPAPLQVDGAGNPIILEVIPTPNGFDVAMGVSGDYAKIKALLGKISTLKRFNSISALAISKVASQAAEGEQAVDAGANGNLQATMTVSFIWLEKENLAVALNSKIFSDDALDMSVADNIGKKMITNMNVLSVGQFGRENPFVK